MPMRWLRRALPVAVLAPLLAACSLDGVQSIMSPAASIAREQHGLFMWTWYLSIPVMVGVFGALFYVLIKFRRRRDDEMPDQSHGNPMTEVILTIVPVIIVIMVAVPSVRSIFRTQTNVVATSDDVVVHVTGYQWWWKFEYPQYGITTANEMHIPAGKRVILQLNSGDVVHAFWVPRLAGKVDLIPNQDNRLWFDTDAEITDEDNGFDVYTGQCAELCLGAHAYMRFRVVVDEQDRFDDWVADFQQPEVVATATDPLVAQGRQLVATKGCIGCHNIGNFAEGVKYGQPQYPDLTNFGLRHTVGAAILDATPENVATWVRDPQEVKPGTRMPTLWQATDPNRDQEAAAIAAYLLSLGVEDGAQAMAQASTGGN